LRHVLVRALSVRPADRFPSMSMLLDELARDRRALVRFALPAAVVAGGAALVIFVLRAFLLPPAIKPGGPAGSAIACALPELTSSCDQEALARAFGEANVTNGARRAARVTAAFGDYAKGFASARSRMCEARLDARSGPRFCLEHIRREVGALVERAKRGEDV